MHKSNGSKTYAKLDSAAETRMAERSKLRRFFIPLFSLILLFGITGMISVMAYEAPEAGVVTALATAPILGAVKLADGEKPKTTAEGDDTGDGGDDTADGGDNSTDGDDAGDGGDGSTDGDDAGDGGDGSEASQKKGGILGMAGRILGLGTKPKTESKAGDETTLEEKYAALSEEWGKCLAKIDTLEAEAKVLTEKAKAGEELAKAVQEQSVLDLAAEKKATGKKAADIAKANFSPQGDKLPGADNSEGGNGFDYESQLGDLHGAEKSAFIRENLASLNQMARQEKRSTSRVDPSKFAGYEAGKN